MRRMYKSKWDQKCLTTAPSAGCLLSSKARKDWHSP